MTGDGFREELEELRALRRFDYAAPAEVVGWARRRTETSDFSPLIFELSELSSPMAADVDDYVSRLAEMADMPYPTVLESVARVALFIAASVEAGACEPVAAARRLASLSDRAPGAGTRLRVFIVLEDYWEEMPEHRQQFEAEIVSELTTLAHDLRGALRHVGGRGVDDVFAA